MLPCYVLRRTKLCIPIKTVLVSEFSKWVSKQTSFTQKWIDSNYFKGDAGSFIIIPNAAGHIDFVLCCVKDYKNVWCVGGLPLMLPQGVYNLDVPPTNYQNFAIAWGLGAYQFSAYKKETRAPAQLFLPREVSSDSINQTVEAIYWVRDLINTPTEKMGPSELAKSAELMCQHYKASFSQIVGDELIYNDFPAIHAVGRASDDPPRLIDIRWGKKKKPMITLIGKGVCFDSGGLDIKPSAAMLLMKKDMGGAAQALGLAKMIMAADLPIQLRVLIPAVENVISGNAYRPGDVINTRGGLTVEITNTDAEGRLILADALAEAVSEKPDLIIDLSTLTGAARVALGTELPAFFTHDDDLANELIQFANQENDPIWRLPLFEGYKDSLKSAIADLNNCPLESYAGAITAALFLKEFVPDDIPWVHFDLMAWNLKTKPGRPQGGEAMAIRGLFSYLQNRFQ